jgi:hypothetical protein
LNEHDGLLEEIRSFDGYITTYSLREWDYTDKRIFEIKYEDLLANEAKTFANLFRHFGFTEQAVRKAVQLAEQCSFKQVSGRSIGQSDAKSHLRSGQPGQWRNVLSQSHLDLIEQLFGDLIEQMGYE